MKKISPNLNLIKRSQEPNPMPGPKPKKLNQDLAGGGNLPQARGATARGRKCGLQTMAGGGNLPQARGATVRGRR